MPKPKWQQKIVEQLETNPMCFVGKTAVVKHVSCLDSSEKKGKMITLRLITNYSHFNKCAGCSKEVR